MAVRTSSWRRLPALIGAAMVGAGCAGAGVSTSGVLTVEQAAKYSASVPFDFVRLRFYDEAQTGALDAIENAAKSYASAIDRLQGRKPKEGMRADRKPELKVEASMVTWPAHFTDKDYFQLVRPVAELKRYCEARVGQWKSIEQYNDDPLAALRADPVAAFLDAHARVTRHLRAQGAYVGFEELRDVIAADVGAEMAEEAAQANRRIDRLFSVEGFRYAQRLGAFGLFSCEQRDKATWRVSILPTTLIGRDPSNQLDSSMARLAIRTYTGRASR